MSWGLCTSSGGGRGLRFLGVRSAALLSGLALAITVGAVPALAQSSNEIVRVEEDWVLVVGDPAPESVAPQVTCAISPQGHLDGLHCTFELNSQSLESYSAGGLQLQVWNGETALAARRYPNHQVMSTSGETVRWTSTMEVQGGQIVFEILAGQSQTWGAFGGQGYLRYAMETSLPNLNGYSPTISTENSGVGYASNRVVSLTLTAVRVVMADGQTLENPNAVTVYPAADGAAP